MGDGPTGTETLLQRCEDVSKGFLWSFLLEKHRFLPVFYVRVMMDGRTDRRMEKWAEGRTDGSKFGQMMERRQSERRTDRQTDRQTDR